MDFDELKTISTDDGTDLDRKLYLVVSATPLKMGKAIRAASGYPYNHISLALSSGIPVMYSFARRFLSAPYYGGFVEESPKRFAYKNRFAWIRVYALSVREATFEALEELIGQMASDREHYLYNFISVAHAVFRKRIIIKDSYTCAEFVSDVISIVSPRTGLVCGGFYTIKDICEALDGSMIYEGTAEGFSQRASWDNDRFIEKLSFSSGLVHTLRDLGQLLRRSVSGTADK